MLHFTKCLEDLPGLVAVPAWWQSQLNGEFERVQAGYLRVKPAAEAIAVPCPKGCGCAHEVIRHHDGTLVGVCQCDPWDCDNMDLRAEDVKLLELKPSRLARAIARALGCEPREAPQQVPNTVQVGAYSTASIPVLLTLPHSRPGFERVISGLVAESEKPFILVAPTSGFMDRRCLQLLERRGAEFLDLATQFEMEADGTLKAKPTVEEVLARVAQKEQKQGGEVRPNIKSAKPGADEVVSLGRFRYLPGFNDVWLGQEHYDLRERTKARLCIQYLVEKKAFDAKSARHFTDDIDPFVRKHGNFQPAAEIRIDHYFTDAHGSKKRLPGLRKALIVAAGRNGKFFLKVG